MIVSFRHRGLKLLFEKGDRRRVLPDYAEKIERVWRKRAKSANWIFPASDCIA